MSGYPDDRDDGPDPTNPRALESARSAVQIPAVLLIVTGTLSLISSVMGLVQLPQVPAQMDEMVAAIDAAPNIPAEEKDAWKNGFLAMKQAAEHPAAAAGYVLGIVSSLLVVIGGVKMMGLTGSAFPMVGSILAMIPCTVGCCCALGLPAGIWALVVLNRPDVRAAFAARRTEPSAHPDDHYMR